MRARVAVVAGSGAIVIALSLLALSNALPTRHEDGAGPLTSVGAPTKDSIRAEPRAEVDAWTFGVQLCLTGDRPAILTAVRPTRAFGSGWALLGTGIRQFVVSASDAPILSTDGWPPSMELDPDPMATTVGYAVTQPCDFPVTGRYTELLIGLGRTGVEGGGWAGIEVAYTVAGRSYVLTLHHEIAICGTLVSCTIPESSDSRATRDARQSGSRDGLDGLVYHVGGTTPGPEGVVARLLSHVRSRDKDQR